MKCIKCNSDIPDGVLVCPVCGANTNPTTVEPETPNNTVPVDTSVLPTVPVTPVLPTDQVSLGEVGASSNINQAPEVQNQVPVTQVPTQVEQSVTPNQNIGNVSENVSTSTSTPTPTPTVDTNINNVPVTQEVEPAQTSANVNTISGQNVNQTQTSAPNAGVVNQAPTEAPQAVVNDINPDFIAPNGESVKLGSTLSPENKKKNNKKNLIIILAIVAVLAIIGIVFFVYYNSQYKSSSKRIDAIVSALSFKTRSLKNDVIEKSSGTYELALNVSSTDANLGVKADGKYAVDLAGKAVDYTINLTSLNLGEELIDKPINLELYLNESRIYVLLQNYFDNYIYDEVEGLSQIFDATEQNNIDYVSLLNAGRVALANSIKSMSNKQTVDTVNIHGTEKKSNVIKIRFNERNRQVFFKTFFNSLANNKNFVTEASKLMSMEEEELKNSLTTAATNEDVYKNMGDLDIEIYTAMFGEVLDGIKISDNNENKNLLEIYPTSNGYGVSYKTGSQNVLDLTLETTSKNTSTTVESTYKISAVFYNEGNAYNIDFDYKNVRDVNPKEAKINVKNSINRQYLTDEQKQAIITSSQESGKIGLYLPSILGMYLNGGVSSESDDDLTSPDMSTGLETPTSDVGCETDPSLCA